jgi:hypothetical protein
MLMRSHDEIRALLGPLAEGKSDDEIDRIRTAAYDFARQVVAAYQAHRRHEAVAAVRAENTALRARRSR